MESNNSEEQPADVPPASRTSIIAVSGPVPLPKALPQPVRKALSKREYFDIFRAYRQAEQGLINSRLTWFLSIQGFLFATYGFSAQKLFEVRAKFPVNNIPAEIVGDNVIYLKGLLYAVPIVGALMSLFVVLGIYAAFHCLKLLKDQWNEEVVPAVDASEPDQPWLPDPAGAGSDRALFYGLHAPFAIPIVFYVAWLYVLWCLFWSNI